MRASLVILVVIGFSAFVSCEDACVDANGAVVDCGDEVSLVDKIEKLEEALQNVDKQLQNLSNLARFRGYTQWGPQDCTKQTDEEQDALMDRACNEAFPGSRAAYIEEMVQMGGGKRNPMPASVQGKCSKDIENCIHANNSICVDGHSRRCVHPGRNFPKDFDEHWLKWGKTGCIKSDKRMRRYALCVLDAEWPYVPIIEPYQHLWDIPDLDFKWSKSLIRRFYFQFYEIKETGDIEKQLREALDSEELVMDVFYGSKSKGADMGAYGDQAQALETIVSYFSTGE